MKIALSIIFILTLNTVFGQSESEYHIDVELTECLDIEKNYTTSGMTQCIIDTTTRWDERLNKSYQALVKTLSIEQKKILINTQKLWIAYRDKEIEFSHQLYNDIQGTMWIPISAETKLNLTRHRTLELESYLDNKTIGNLPLVHE